MGGTCAADADCPEIPAAVLTIPQQLNVKNVQGSISYQYHSHTSACRISGSHSWKQTGTGTNGNGDSLTYYKCNKCGKSYTGNSGANNFPPSSGCSYYSCGYSDGQLIGATITFD